MAEGTDESVHTGDISGTGIAVGHGAQANVSINSESRKEILELVKQLRDEVSGSKLSEGSKKVILDKAVPEMETAASAGDKSGIEKGLERINDQLEGAGAVATDVAGIVGKLAKIAAAAGIAIHAVAPFIAGLL